jgi:hypothetical protein
MRNVSLFVKKMVCRLLILVLLAMTILSPTPAIAAVTLNTNDISNFTQLGSQPPSTSSTTLQFSDSSNADVCGIYANDPDAASGGDLDLTVTFQVRSSTANNADGGFRVVINDGQTRSAIAACVTLNNQRVIALAGAGPAAEPATYLASVAVDWLGTVTLRLRRWADGGSEILEVNGVPPNPRVLLLPDQVSGKTRTGATVELGCLSPESLCDADVTQFFTEPPYTPQVILPVNGVAPTLTPVTINNGSGDQYDPHISGDLVAYTSDPSIRYYSVATDTDAQIPLGSSARDLLSDVSGSKIAFSRVIPAVKTAVMVFDTSTPATAPIEIDAALGTTRIGSAIGGDTVAYIDFGLHGNGELVIHDLASSTSVRATNDAAFDGNPSVSPDGNVVTWEHCAISTSNCDIWQAVKNGAVWDVSPASDTANPEANPDTNGTLIVYDSVRPNGDIFWRPVAGGTEVQLQLAGTEANPSIAGNLIVFESRPTLLATSDIFVYDISTNLLYQITDTPLVTEQLNDISVLPDGRIRTVWTGDEDGFDQRNVHGATFSLPAGDDTPPVIDPISDVVVTLPPNSTATSMIVTFPTPTATDDSGTATVTTSPSSGEVFPVGKTTVAVTATDDAGNIATSSFTVTVLHNFSGFLQPVENLPLLNVINAGQAVPVKFSLSGNKGLNILAAGYPISGQIACDANEPGAVIEETFAAGGSSLSYDAAADVYGYVWKTDKAWKGTCRVLALRLKDGSDHFAKFRFR